MQTFALSYASIFVSTRGYLLGRRINLDQILGPAAYIKRKKISLGLCRRIMSGRNEITRRDEELLARLGYKQEFKRAFTPLEVCSHLRKADISLLLPRGSE